MVCGIQKQKQMLTTWSEYKNKPLS